MWRKIARVSAYMLAVALIVTYMCYASNLASKHRAQQQIEEVIISLPNNSEELNFTSVSQVLEDLKENGLIVEGTSVDNVDVLAISKHIAKAGYVCSANAYVTYAGKLYIEVMQHCPVLRLLCGDFNTYATAENYVFCVPSQSSCYAPVVTGCYKPLFPSDYEGVVGDYYAELIADEAQVVTELDNELSGLARDKKQVVDKLSSAKNSAADKYKEELASLTSLENALTERKQTAEARKKKLQKKSDDFVNLTNFVSEVNNDAFWSAEIVQYVADTTYTGDISLRLIPRSGNFVIEFGTLNNSGAKLEKLRKFYDKGLSHMGWNRYKSVDVRYDKQIICKE